MIKNITLHEFQVHKNLTLEFSEGVNVLIGPTDSGKSSVFRAFKLALLNTPRGGEKIYLSDGADSPMEIQITDTLGNTIVRKNRSYIINGKTTLTAFNQDKPEAVMKILRVSKLNFQAQLDPHFLILETGGNAAKILNKITGMEDQILILSETKSRIDQTKKNFVALSKEKELVEQKITQLSDAPILLNQLKKVAKDTETWKSEWSIIESLSKTIFPLETNLKTRKDMDFLDELKIEFSKIFESINSYQETEKTLNYLLKLCTDLESYTQLSKDIPDVTNTDLQMRSLLKAIEESNSRENDTSKLYRYVYNLQELEQKTQNLDFEIDENRMKFDSLMKLSGKCPLCGAMQK